MTVTDCLNERPVVNFFKGQKYDGKNAFKVSSEAHQYSDQQARVNFEKIMQCDSRIASKTNEQPKKVLKGCWQHNGVNEQLRCQQRRSIRITAAENEILEAPNHRNIYDFTFLLNAALNLLPVGSRPQNIKLSLQV